ncbi:hypothetical protein V2I01_18300 [Micromonospora sp. BRA006-A]|nr:hypothetical protein [Micromonospora sp. BRA006-A]
MDFDPLATARRALWIGGAQWAGKTTLAVTLALRYGLTAYLYDRHDARGHDDRRIADRIRRGEPPDGPDAEATWVTTDPERMAAETLAGFPRRFEWVLDDLSALVSGRRVVAEGWGCGPNWSPRSSSRQGRWWCWCRRRSSARTRWNGCRGRRPATPV